MATLTKIFTGMEKGPEAIQGNFDALNRGKVDNVNVLEKQITNNGWVINGGIILRRSGKVCTVFFNGQAGKDINRNSDVFLQFPAGFTPTNRYVYRTQDGKTININPSGVTTDTKFPANDYLVFEFWYLTNDDMPS